MHIKRLTIQGFKSYRDQTVVDPFSAGVNVVVGRNGSGKSNFFSAIRFVLSDAYTSLSRDQRQSLLHEGAGTAATFSAFVEIVFDNEDSRFPTGKDEVILRRTVGAKKDEYSLDRKSTSKGEVMSLLESAGFSRSNPYYIVPQGRITHLTNQKDPERLDLLKEVAGTKVYEDRRTESLKIIEETDTKREKIVELLGYIDERLSELEAEKKELKEYTSRDRERRALEYTIYQRNLEEASEALDSLEDERRESINNANTARESYEKRQREIASKENEQSDTQQTIDMLALEKAQLTSDRKDAAKSRTQIECIIRDLQEATSSSVSARSDIENELRQLESEIQAKQSSLAKITPQWETATNREKELKALIEDASTRQAVLYDKQGRSTQFKTQRERDAFLRSELDKLGLQIPSSAERVQDTASNISRAQESLKMCGEKIDGLTAQLEGRGGSLKELSDQVQKLKDEQIEMMERRKQIWKEDTKLDATVRHAREEMQNAERLLFSAMDKNTSAGLRAVTRIIKDHNIDGVYGPMYSLFTVFDSYRQAAEVAAGASLFHIVVRDDGVATRVLDIMQRERAGRVTFVPLNRLNIKPVQYPDTQEIQPLIRKLRFEADVTKAFEQVFGKILVCNKLEEAGAAMRRYNLTVITMDGDRVDRKGALTGGFHDYKRSRLDSAVKLQRWTETHEQDAAKHAKVKSELAALDQNITRLGGEIGNLEKKLQNAKDGRQPVVVELSGLRKEQEQLQDRIQKLKSAHDRQQNELKSMETQQTAYETELATPMLQALTQDELDTLDALTKALETHKQELTKITRTCSKLGGEKSILEIELNETLRRQRDDCKDRLEQLSAGGTGDAPEDAIASRTAELARLNSSVDAFQEKLRDVEEQIDAATATLQQIEKDIDKLHSQQSEDARGINKQQKGAERYHAKRQLLTQRKEECSNSIRDLGVLPEEAFEKYTSVSSDKLVKSLHKTNEALKKFSHVNKKAVEQFSGFTTQKDQLETRREELENSSKSIEELVDVLDQRKDEAIARTFKQVSKYFSEIFEKLVPAGRGRLIMQKRLGDGAQIESELNDAETQDTANGDALPSEQEDEEDDAMDVDDDEDQDEDEDEGRPKRKKRKSKGKGKAKQPAPDKQKKRKRSVIDSYTGVAIQVSFNSKYDEGLRIQQLSGGQKSLVALTMVFAIQKCDPAPFYLFDEIDANLDADRRTAIAAMIKELSADGQFIITTFRPELLIHADQFLGVIFDARKISTIKNITQDECYQFVEANEKTG